MNAPRESGEIHVIIGLWDCTLHVTPLSSARGRAHLASAGPSPATRTMTSLLCCTSPPQGPNMPIGRDITDPTAPLWKASEMEDKVTMDRYTKHLIKTQLRLSSASSIGYLCYIRFMIGRIP
jgi:hypothetical protein